MENKPLGLMERKMLNVLTFFLIFFEALIHLKMSLFFPYNFQFLTFSLQMAKFPYDKEISLQVEALTIIELCQHYQHSVAITVLIRT